MKKLTLLALTLLAYVVPCLAAPADYTIKKVEVDMVPSPDFNAGNQQGIRWAPQKWIRIEVTFDAVPEFTDELQFNYYALMAERPADRLLVGKVAHVNICKGGGLHSVMYISPQSLAKFFGGRKQVNNVSSLFTQITVTLSKTGSPAPVSIASLKTGGHGEWWSTLKQEEGFLVNKNETPFAPLFWDYYEAIKAR